MILRALLLVFVCATSLSAQSISAQYSDAADRLIRAAIQDSSTYHRLAELTDRFGPRLSGSENLERAIDWILAQMKSDGLDNVRGEPVMVPHWVRGRESAELVEPRRANLPMLGLGGSIATPPGGITAEVMVVRSFDELTRRASDARGKIVLFNVPFTSYGQTVQYRTQGAIAAARQMLMLARCGLVHAEELCAKGSRGNGQGQQGGRDLRVLLVGLRVHAGRGGGGVGSMIRKSGYRFSEKIMQTRS